MLYVSVTFAIEELAAHLVPRGVRAGRYGLACSRSLGAFDGFADVVAGVSGAFSWYGVVVRARCLGVWEHGRAGEVGADVLEPPGGPGRGYWL